MALDTEKSNFNKNKYLKFSVADFSGGANMSIDPLKLNDNQYFMLINGRSRFGVLTPISGPLDSFGLVGKYQGTYGIGSYIVVIVSGKIYARNFSQAGSSFFQVTQLTLDSTVDVIYAQAVPSSAQNNQRVPASSSSSAGITLASRVDGTPRCLVLQDGINRPLLVFPDGSVRTANDFADWENVLVGSGYDRREYVPVGKQMLFKDGILYIVSPDGTEIYRSVSGRPLDFVVAIDNNGNKLSDGLLVEASRYSIKVDFEVITCIDDLKASDGSFYISTAKASFAVTPDLTNLVYAEPTYTNRTLFPIGCNNQFSLARLSGRQVDGNFPGDRALITVDGIHSFAAVVSSENEGKDEPFHTAVLKLFENINQDTTASANFESYALFAINSIYGRGILLYDQVRGVFSGFDLIDDAIKMFALIEVDKRKRLFFITDTGLFEAYAGSTERMQLYTKEWASGDAEVGISPVSTIVVYQKSQNVGKVYATNILDSAKQTRRERSSVVSAAAVGEEFPFQGRSDDDLKRVTFATPNDPRGWKVGTHMEIDFDCEVLGLQLKVQALPRQLDIDDQKRLYNV